MSTKNKQGRLKFALVGFIVCFALYGLSILTTPSDNSNTQNNITSESTAYVSFRNADLLNQHYDKHGRMMGYANAEAYEAAARNVVNNPASLHKLEAEDNDDVYYLESTNDFVIVSTDGYIRTYFRPNDGKAYFDRQ